MNCSCYIKDVLPLLLMSSCWGLIHAVALQDVSKKNDRSSINEVHLVIMRLLSVFMSRTKSSSKSSSEVDSLFDRNTFQKC